MGVGQSSNKFRLKVKVGDRRFWKLEGSKKFGAVSMFFGKSNLNGSNTKFGTGVILMHKSNLEFGQKSRKVQTQFGVGSIFLEPTCSWILARMQEAYKKAIQNLYREFGFSEKNLGGLLLQSCSQVRMKSMVFWFSGVRRMTAVQSSNSWKSRARAAFLKLG